MNREWTDEEIEILRRDRAAKVPVPVTAAKLNRPVPATYLRARMIGTQVQKHQSWGEEEVAQLRALVTANPPMTDKRIAETLGRTVTQVRWKMQDIGLIGVRDLSKLAKATSAAAASRQALSEPNARKLRDQVKPCPSKPAANAERSKPLQGLEQPRSSDTQMLAAALSRLAKKFDDVLKGAIAESENGMMQAAMAAIAEKKSIDERLVKLCRAAKPVSAPSSSSEQTAQEIALAAGVEQQAARSAPPKEQRISASKPAQPRAEATAPRGVVNDNTGLRARHLAARPASRPASVPLPPPPAPAPPPRIVVLDSPAPARPDMPAPDMQQTSGRGGWKSVRRDPAKIAAQSRAKSVNRADAVDLAQAAQAAIEQFIAQRGVTRSEVGGTQALVTRLQSRGYIVVSEGEGWVIDQRHRVADDKALMAFAAARGINLDAAA
ncbi:hypothetical protein [Microvirga subterranea]|uniref:GcrA cell cycle regulator n=1 Tax=Microvirga subterranea TaxID=186651 RepID=A0A370HHH3_9HYPH|nr:hypothetical protein [Microvirga subterranea]RDI56820.1 hypothetical protein DES45_108169 [Microvirga subterranea]